MRSYETSIESPGETVNIVIWDDSSLELVGYDREYDLSLEEFGEGQSGIAILMEYWQKNFLEALLFYIIPNVEPLLELLADVLSLAYQMSPFYDSPKLASVMHKKYKVTDFIDSLFKLIENRKLLSYGEKYQAEPDYNAVQVYEYDAFDTPRNFSEELRSIKNDTDRHALSNLFEATGYAARAAKRSVYVHRYQDARTGLEQQEKMGADDNSWFSTIKSSSASCFDSAAWSMTFARGLYTEESHDESRLWVLRRFITIMNAKKAGQKPYEPSWGRP